jgi:ABC-type branched-subunit amino acid transport system substrate-binding protein
MRGSRTIAAWRFVAVAAAGMIAVGAGAGCGSSDSDTTSSSASTGSTTAKPSGPPLKIYSVAPVDSPLASEPEIFAGAKAAVRALNERGGIAGREVELVACNGKSDPNEEVACARNAVSDGAIAVVGALTPMNGQGFTDTLSDGGVANVADVAISPAEFSQPINFPIDAAGLVYVGCGALGAKASDTSNVTLLSLNLAVSKAVAGLMGQGAQVAGVPVKGPITFPPSQGDLSPIVQQVANSDPGIVALGLTPQVIGQFIDAANSQGRDWPMCAASGTMDGKLLSAVSAQNMYGATGFPPLSDAATNPQLKRFREEMEAEKAGGDDAADTSAEGYNEASLRAWLGVQVVADVANGIKGDVTPERFLEAISQATVDTGVVPPLDFAKPQRVKGYERMFNPMVELTKWNADSKSFESIGGLEAFNALDALR